MAGLIAQFLVDPAHSIEPDHSLALDAWVFDNANETSEWVDGIGPTAGRVGRLQSLVRHLFGFLKRHIKNFSAVVPKVSGVG